MLQFHSTIHEPPLSPTFSPVKFGDPSVVTFVSLFHGNLNLSITSETLRKRYSPQVVPCSDSIAKSSFIISKLSLIPLTKIKSCAVSLTSLLLSSANK